MATKEKKKDARRVAEIFSDPQWEFKPREARFLARKGKYDLWWASHKRGPIFIAVGPHESAFSAAWSQSARDALKPIIRSRRIIRGRQRWRKRGVYILRARRSREMKKTTRKKIVADAKWAAAILEGKPLVGMRVRILAVIFGRRGPKRGRVGRVTRVGRASFDVGLSEDLELTRIPIFEFGKSFVPY
jgi:hypothetical protein